jgi:HEAT repeat protein
MKGGVEVSPFDPERMKAMVIEGMIEDLKAEDRSVQIQAAITLGKTLARKGGDVGRLEARAVEALTQALESEDQDLREAAREAIEGIKAKKG